MVDALEAFFGAGGLPLAKGDDTSEIAAAELLERAGFTKKGDKWFMPDGKPFAIKLMVEGESRPVMTRAGSICT